MSPDIHIPKPPKWTEPLLGPFAGPLSQGQNPIKTIGGEIHAATNVLGWLADPVAVGETFLGLLLIGVGIAYMLKISPTQLTPTGLVASVAKGK